MKNKNIVITVASIIFIAFAFAAAVKPPDEFKNLKVLPKNISPEALDKIMDEFKLSLGVKCGYCHARSEDNKHIDFASDSKPEKDMARMMMRMTDDLNKKYFQDSSTVKAVSCYTCHHGNAQPAIDSADYRRKSM